jgi:hypothetical protein
MIYPFKFIRWLHGELDSTNQQQVQARLSIDRNSIQRPWYVVRQQRSPLIITHMHASSSRLSTTVRCPPQDRIHTHVTIKWAWNVIPDYGISTFKGQAGKQNVVGRRTVWQRGEEQEKVSRPAIQGRRRSGEPFGSFLHVSANFWTHFHSSSLCSNNYYLLKCDDNIDRQATDESEQTIFWRWLLPLFNIKCGAEGD